tara:strand:- start:17 stop:553 length:537 start_codon:yes stop_codon:yes gene_type:complete
MNKTQEPKQNPGLGNWDPVWVEWALNNLSDAELLKVFNYPLPDDPAKPNKKKIAAIAEVELLTEEQKAERAAQKQRNAFNDLKISVEALPNEYAEELLKVLQLRFNVSTGPAAVVEPPKIEEPKAEEPSDDVKTFESFQITEETELDRKDMHFKKFKEKYGILPKQYDEIKKERGLDA